MFYSISCPILTGTHKLSFRSIYRIVSLWQAVLGTKDKEEDNVGLTSGGRRVSISFFLFGRPSLGQRTKKRTTWDSPVEADASLSHCFSLAGRPWDEGRRRGQRGTHQWRQTYLYLIVSLWQAVLGTVDEEEDNVGLTSGGRRVSISLFLFGRPSLGRKTKKRITWDSPVEADESLSRTPYTWILQHRKLRASRNLSKIY